MGRIYVAHFPLFFDFDSSFEDPFFFTFFRFFSKKYLDLSLERTTEILTQTCVGILLLKQCWRYFLEVSFGAVGTKEHEEKAKKADGKLLREEGVGRRVPSGSAESEAGPYNQVIPSKHCCRDICKYVYICANFFSEMRATGTGSRTYSQAHITRRGGSRKKCEFRMYVLVIETPP